MAVAVLKEPTCLIRESVCLLPNAPATLEIKLYTLNSPLSSKGTNGEFLLIATINDNSSITVLNDRFFLLSSCKMGKLSCKGHHTGHNPKGTKQHTSRNVNQN